MSTSRALTPEGSWAGYERTLVATPSMTALRLFLSAWFMALSASLLILPTAILSTGSDLQTLRGVLAAGTGIALLWLGFWRPPVTLFVATHAALALPQLWLVANWLLASPAAAGMYLLFGIGILICGASGLAGDRFRLQAKTDWLTMLVAATVAIHGLAMILGADASWRVVEGIGLPSVWYGAAMLISGSAAAAIAVRGVPAGRWALPGRVAGALLATIVVVAAITIQPLYWFVVASVYLRVTVLLAPGAWSRLGHWFVWSSLGARLGAAFVTAAFLPALALAWILSGTAGQGIDSVSARQLAASLVTVVLIGAFAGGFALGQRLSRELRDLADAVRGLREGRPFVPIRSNVLEPALLGDAIAEMVTTIGLQRAEAERRIEQAEEAQRGLSSSLEMGEALTSFVSSLVPSLCDVAAIVVRRGDVVEQYTSDAPGGRGVDAARVFGISSAGSVLLDVADSGERHVDLGGADAAPDSPSGDGSLDESSEPVVTGRLAVPILAADATVRGALGVAMVGRYRQFSPADVAAIDDFAARAAIAIERMDLHADLVRSINELQTANAVKDEFLGLVSHELKTPITTILGTASLLDRDPDRTDRTSLLAELALEADRLDGMVDNLLALARLDAGRIVEPEPVQLERLAAAVIERLRPRARGRVLRMVAAGAAIVEASDQYLEMVVRNLLTNAEKYGDPGSPVDVTVSTVGQRAVLTVADIGPGLTDEEASRVFDTFYRSPTNRDRAAGMGIGLAVCQRIVGALGGQVWAVRRTDISGSVFAIWLPAAPDDEATKTEAPQPLTGPELSRLTVRAQEAAWASAERARSQAEG